VDEGEEPSTRGGAPRVASSCSMSESEHCPIENMIPNQWNNVLPGGDTRCLLSSSPTYKFQVIPGDPRNVLIYFQGGGACWDQGSMYARLCFFDVEEYGLNGIFKRDKKENPFRDFTVVSVGYCSGDEHIGNTARAWRGPRGAKVEQRGYNNAKAAIDWTMQHLGSSVGLDSLVLAGSSAGALGIKAWSRQLLTSFSYQQAAVIGDSYVGVYPEGVDGPMLREYGACTTPLLPDELKAVCNEGSLDSNAMYAMTMQDNPAVTFASVTSKTDEAQIAFYNAISFSFGRRTLIEEADFLQQMGAVQDFLASAPNFVVFDVNDKHHVFLAHHKVYTTRVGSTQLITWLAGLPVKPGEGIASFCEAKAGSAAHECACWEYCPAVASVNTYSRMLPRVQQVEEQVAIGTVHR